MNSAYVCLMMRVNVCKWSLSMFIWCFRNQPHAKSAGVHKHNKCWLNQRMMYRLCVCVSYWVLAGKAKVRRTSQKKGIGSHTLAKVCKADSGAIWNWNYRDLKKTVWIWAVAEKIWVYGWTTNFIICFSYILRDFKFEMISWQDCPPSGDQGLCHEKSIQCSNWTRWIWTGTAIRRPPHLLVAIGHQQDVDDLPFQFATVLYYIHQK